MYSRCLRGNFRDFKGPKRLCIWLAQTQVSPTDFSPLHSVFPPARSLRLRFAGSERVTPSWWWKFRPLARPLHLVTERAWSIHESPRYIIPRLKLHRLYNTVEQHRRIMLSPTKEETIVMKSTKLAGCWTSRFPRSEVSREYHFSLLPYHKTCIVEQWVIKI